MAGNRQQVPLAVGEGADMQVNPQLWKKWQNDACDADDWKHGRVSDAYRDHYDETFSSKPATKEVRV